MPHAPTSAVIGDRGSDSDRRRRSRSSRHAGPLGPSEVGQVLADVVGPDRQLAVAAVDQHGELHRRGRPSRASASSAARTVRPENSTSSTRITTVPSMPPGGSIVVRASARGSAQAQIVAVQRDVERADRDGDAPNAAIRSASRCGQRDTTGRDAEQDESRQPSVCSMICGRCGSTCARCQRTSSSREFWQRPGRHRPGR